MHVQVNETFMIALNALVSIVSLASLAFVAFVSSASRDGWGVGAIKGIEAQEGLGIQADSE